MLHVVQWQTYFILVAIIPLVMPMSQDEKGMGTERRGGGWGGGERGKTKMPRNRRISVER